MEAFSRRFKFVQIMIPGVGMGRNWGRESNFYIEICKIEIINDNL